MRGDHGKGRPAHPARGRRRAELPGDLTAHLATRLPLHRPYRGGRGAEYVAEAIESGASFNHAAAAVTPNTRVVLPTHYAGVACDMAALARLADRHGLAVIEDAAHGLYADVEGRPLGSLGDAGCFSFDRVKNVSSGEGGALAVNGDDWVERAEVLGERGTNRAAFERGEVAEYSWVDLGAAAVPGELTAAYLWAQLEVAEEIVAQRLAVWSMYAGGGEPPPAL